MEITKSHEFDDNRQNLYLYYDIVEHYPSKVRALISSVKNLLTVSYEFRGDWNGFVFFNTVAREDHEGLFKCIYDQCVYEKNRIQLQKKKTFNFYALCLLWTNLREFRKLKKISMPRETESPNHHYVEPSLLIRMIMFVRIIQSIVIQDTLDIIIFDKVKAVIVLTDIWMAENCLIKVSNRKGIPTVTAQHGLSLPNIEMGSVDVLNYWHAPSKYVMTWGTESSKLYTKYSDGIISVVCGNPRIQEKYYESNGNYVGLALDLPKYKSYNQQMVRIVEDYARLNQLRVRIRKHPLDKESNYIIDPDITSFNGEINNAKFIAAHTTTMIFTYMAQGKCVCKYKSDIPFHNMDKQLCFGSLNELAQFATNYCSKKNNQSAQMQIEYIGEESKNHYRDFFDKLNITRRELL